jgi:hypothetical protein
MRHVCTYILYLRVSAGWSLETGGIIRCFLLLAAAFPPESFDMMMFLFELEGHCISNAMLPVTVHSGLKPPPRPAGDISINQICQQKASIKVTVACRNDIQDIIIPSS